jgi:2-oxoglutarate ferredoxin oxidoreductase subunit beta
VRFNVDVQPPLVPLLKAAVTHNGAAFLDVISPCVAFNNHLGSIKSFDFVREHNEAVSRIDFSTTRQPIKVDDEPGTVGVVTQHDGSVLRLRKVAPDYDVHNRIAAMNYLQEPQAVGEMVTGLLHLEPEVEDLHGCLHTVEKAVQRAR